MFYKVINSPEIPEFCQLINKALKDGWTCLGGIACDEFLYNQSMVIDKLPAGEILEFELLD